MRKKEAWNAEKRKKKKEQSPVWGQHWSHLPHPGRALSVLGRRQGEPAPELQMHLLNQTLGRTLVDESMANALSLLSPHPFFPRGRY